MDDTTTTAGLDFSGITLPFNVTDLVSSGNSLLALVGGFVLLAMAFVFVPKLIGLIRNSFAAGRS